MRKHRLTATGKGLDLGRTPKPRVAFGTLLLLASLAGSAALAQESGGGSKSDAWIGFEGYGRAPYPVTSQGLRLGHDLPGGYGIEVTYIKARQTVLLSDFSVSEYELRLNSSMGSLAYWGLGVGVRDVKLDYDVFVVDEAEARHVSEEAQIITVAGHLGIEIPIFSALSLGSDLYGISVPAHWTKRGASYPEGVEDFEENPRTFPYVKSGFSVCYQLVRTYLSIRF